MTKVSSQIEGILYKNFDRKLLTFQIQKKSI